MSKWEKNPQDKVVHYGVKGMHWGVRKEDEGTNRFTSGGLAMDSGFNKKTRDAAVEVTNLIRDRYGYDINTVKTIGPDHPEYPGTLAYVENVNLVKGAVHGTIFMQKKDFTPVLSEAESSGWMAPGTANTRALLTHESAHSVFHSDQKPVNGFLGPKRVGSKVKALDKALKAAAKVARRDGVSVLDISGYARTSGSLGELEAELFSNYHWGSNPPPYVKAWGEALHQELGVDPTPFKEVR